MRPGTQFEGAPARAGATGQGGALPDNTDLRAHGPLRRSQGTLGEMAGRRACATRPNRANIEELRRPAPAHRGRRRGKVQHTFDPDREDRAVADRQA